MPISTRRASRADFIHDELLSADLGARTLAGKLGEYPYDALVLALGATAEYYGITGAREHSTPIDSRITSYNVCYTKLLRFIFLFLAAHGGGDWSIDGLLRRRRAPRAATTPSA